MNCPGSESESFGHAQAQIDLGHHGVYLNDVKLQRLRLLVEAFGKHPIAIQQVAEGPFWITGLPGDGPCRAPAFDRGPAELGSRQEPDGLA